MHPRSLVISSMDQESSEERSELVAVAYIHDLRLAMRIMLRAWVPGAREIQNESWHWANLVQIKDGVANDVTPHLSARWY